MAALQKRAGEAVVKDAARNLGRMDTPVAGPAMIDTLGVVEAFRAAAGPDIRRLALFAYESSIVAPMPKPRTSGTWGRALGRETLE